MVKVITPFKIQKWVVGAEEDSMLRRSLTIKAKAAISVSIVLLTVVSTVILVCLLMPVILKTNWMPEYHSVSRLGRFEAAAISTDAAPCAVIGKNMLEKNGSAVDAAIAVLVCMGLVNPQSSGLGGGFLMIYYNRTDETVHYIDAREVAPQAATEDMFHGNATLAAYGGLAVAVPGELAGYYDIHNRFGALPWRDLFPPTIKMCRDGVKVNPHLARALKKFEAHIHRFEHIRNLFVDNATGHVLQEDDVFKRNDLADTLEAIAKDGKSAIYGPSELATRFLADLKAAGSIIEESDMIRYTSRSLDPVRMSLRDNMTFYSVSQPGSGALLAFILGVLDGFGDLNPDVTKTRSSTVLALHRIIETFKFAYAWRMKMQDDDPVEMEKLVREITSREYIDRIRSLIDDEKTFNDPAHYGVDVTITEDHGTAHLSIIAANGDAVSVTSTVNLYFGSMELSPSTGIILNDEMKDFTSPNVTNFFGVPPTGKNKIRPGMRPLSSMSPAIIVDSNGDVRLNIGGSGGTRITTSVAQTIIRNLWLHEDIKKAIDAPRFHHRLLPMYIEHEALFPETLLNDLKNKGHDLHTLDGRMHRIIMGIARGEDGFLYANSDYRKAGDVDGF